MTTQTPDVLYPFAVNGEQLLLLRYAVELYLARAGTRARDERLSDESRVEDKEAIPHLEMLADKIRRAARQ